MRLSDFQYDLPRELIAQFPLRDRAAARLMIVDRKTKEISHSVFREVGDFLNRDDVLVLNNTRVFKARMFAQKDTGGKIEILLVKTSGRNEWEAMVSHAKRVKQGARLLLDKDTYATIEEKLGGARVIVRFSEDSKGIIDKFGMVPLPQYIKRYPVPDDEVQYQTTFAKTTGSIAAPTAGLHFTDRLLDEIKKRGVVVSETTLHIGPGTFKPIRSEQVEDHNMDAEFFEIPDAALAKIKNARKVIALGTSVCRTLETYARTGETNGWAHLFIYPGFEFRVVDSLFTNLHLPCSTPLLLVAAFAGRELIFKAYEEAIRHKYRFLSYGDAMLIV
jgi:S-adenosylmethionine:tRNA ribosyltransferase-isomerase